MRLVSVERPINTQQEQLHDTQQERLHYLDWLRVLVVLAVFYAHTTYIFDTLFWHIRNGQQRAELEALFVFFSQWGMSLMFLLAGASAWFVLRSRTGGQFRSERFKRLAIPFIVGFIFPRLCWPLSCSPCSTRTSGTIPVHSHRGHSHFRSVLSTVE